MRPKKLMVIGLDCAAPELVFDRWRDQLPNLSQLMSKGIYGPLESSMPPITVPAWACMMSGKDPGYLGVYGFRNRKDRSYENLGMATSLAFKEDMVWDHLGRRGKKSVVLSFPPSYPVKPIVGWSTACFLTPNSQSAYTHPPELKEELENATGPYIPDVMNFRTDDKDNLLEQIHGRIHGERKGLGFFHDGGNGRRSHSSRTLEILQSHPSSIRARQSLRKQYS
jgi:predicted AlkP superfamily phosphohydrolase/phosphomutase